MIAVDNDDTQDRFTGFAVANPNDSNNIRIKLVTMNENGTIADTISPAELKPLAPILPYFGNGEIVA